MFENGSSRSAGLYDSNIQAHAVCHSSAALYPFWNKERIAGYSFWKVVRTLAAAMWIMWPSHSRPAAGSGGSVRGATRVRSINVVSPPENRISGSSEDHAPPDMP